MTKASDNEFPSVLFDEQPSDVSTPASGFWRAFFKSDGMYVIDDAGTVTGPFGAGGSGDVATDPIWDAAGDLVVGTGANAAARLAIGATNGMAVQRVSGAVAWKLPQGHELAYTEFTSDTNVTSTNSASPDTIVTASGVAFDGSTRAKVEFWAVQGVVATAAFQFYIWDDTGGGAASIGLLIRLQGLTRAGLYGVRYLTPSAATHTFSIRATTGGGTAVVGAGTGGTTNSFPGFIRVSVA